MYLCIFMTILMIPFVTLNQFWMIWHQSRYTGRVLATNMCVVLEYSSQGANGVKEQASFSLYMITTLGKCLGRARRPHRRTRAAGCTFFLLPGSSWSGRGKELEMLNHNVPWGNTLVLQMTKKAAITYKVRNWKGKRNTYDDLVL